MRNIKRIIAALLALSLLILCGCGSGRKKEEQEIKESTPGTDVVRAAEADSVFSMNSNSKYSKNPFVATNHANQLLCDLVYENIIELDDSFEVIDGAGIVTEWSCDDTGKNWELTVGEGHVFHDGSDVTPRDISYSIGYAVNSDRFHGRFASFQGASPGEGKVYVTLGISDFQFIKLLNLPVIKAGTYGDEGPAGNTPVGSGPYTYNEDGTALVAFEGYPGYEDLPVDTIYLKEYTSADAVISAFEDGYIDVVINDPSSYTNLGYASSNEIHAYATTNMHFVAFNETSMLGRYSYFRIAMQYAFDREYLVELLHGNAVATPVPMYPTCSAYPTSLANGLRYNLETCRKILEGSGVQDYDDDGQLEFMSGSAQEIELHFIVCADSSAKAGIVRRFQSDMASIGLKVVVHELPWDEYLKCLEEGKIQVGESEDNTVPVDMYYGEVKLRNNFDLTELLQTRTEDNQMTNLNYSGSEDSAVLGYINQYLASNNAMRPNTYYQLCEYITGSAGSLITIGFEKQQIITHRGVCKGINANFGNPLFNFQNWKINLE